MKRTLAVLLAAVMLFSFAACKKDEETVQNVSVEHGVTENGTYTNTFAELTFSSPEGWVYESDEALLAIPEVEVKELSSGLQNDILRKYGIAYDMMCSAPSYENSVSLVFADTNYEEFEDFTDTEDFLRELLKQTTLDTSDIEKSEVTLSGKNYIRLCAATKDASGAPAYAVFYGRKVANIIIVIVAACTDSFTVAEAESCFG